MTTGKVMRAQDRRAAVCDRIPGKFPLNRIRRRDELHYVNTAPERSFDPIAIYTSHQRSRIDSSAMRSKTIMAGYSNRAANRRTTTNFSPCKQRETNLEVQFLWLGFSYLPAAIGAHADQRVTG
jgi:hypothetical protein